MGAQRVQMKGVFPWLAQWALQAGTRDFQPAFGALVDPVQNIFFLAVHYDFQFIFPHRLASWAGSRSGVTINLFLINFFLALVACLLMCVSGSAGTNAGKTRYVPGRVRGP
jgi:hypothetical protein